MLAPPSGAVAYYPGLPVDATYLRDWVTAANAIDVGSLTMDGDSNTLVNWTFMDLSNPSNYNGKIDTVKIWAKSNLAGCRVGTFYLVSGTTYACRDSVAIGSVTSGSEQTFTGLDISVNAGDYIGIYTSTGQCEANIAGGSGVYYSSGNKCVTGTSAVYSDYSSIATKISLYATGLGRNDGTITGATWVRLPSGLCGLSHDGVDDAIDYGNNASIRISNNQTIKFWFRVPTIFQTVDATTSAILLSRYDFGASKRVWQIGLYNKTAGAAAANRLVIYLGDPADGTTEYSGYWDSALSVDTNYHCVVTFASGILILYVNGVARTLTAIFGAVPASLFSTDIKLMQGCNLNNGVNANFGKHSFFLETIVGTTAWTQAQVTSSFDSEKYLLGV